MKWLDSMVLRKKLILVSAIFSIGLLVSGAIAYIGVNRWSDEMHVISEQRLPIMVALAEVDHERMVIRAQTFEVWRYKNSADPADKFLTILDGRKKSWENIDKTWMVIDEFHPKTDEGKKAKEELIPLYKEWREIYVELDRILGEMAASHNPAHQELLFKRYEEAVNRMVGISDGMGKSIDGFTAINQRNTIAMVNNAKEDAEHYTLTMIVTVLTILAVALTVGYMISASISRSISQSVIAIRDGAMQITSASDQVAASSSSLAQGASEQASSVEQVSATLKENTAINAQNVDNARQADILAKNANDAAHAGFDKGEELSRSMNTITESATKISGIIKTIDQIAFQTNLLALNAAVEAARAGEHGLGFAVVADEVRNLAQRAASAAKETSVIIEGVVSQIKEGNKIVETTRDSFKEIVDQSKKVSDLIGEIAISGKEQSEGLSEINLAMNQVDQVTQQVAANSEEAAAAAEELNAQAVSMMETVRLLAAVVGMENENGMVRKHSSHDKHLDLHTTHVHPSPHSKNVSKAEEIFPLHEDDLKEF